MQETQKHESESPQVSSSNWVTGNTREGRRDKHRRRKPAVNPKSAKFYQTNDPVSSTNARGRKRRGRRNSYRLKDI